MPEDAKATPPAAPPAPAAAAPAPTPPKAPEPPPEPPKAVEKPVEPVKVNTAPPAPPAEVIPPTPFSDDAERKLYTEDPAEYARRQNEAKTVHVITDKEREVMEGPGTPNTEVATKK